MIRVTRYIPLFLFITLLLAVLPVMQVRAQNSMKGQLVSARDTTALYGAVILLRHFPDSVLHGDVADTSGYFSFHNLPDGDYKMTIRFSSFIPYQRSFHLQDSSHVDLGVVAMFPDSTMIGTVLIKSNMIRIVAKNDTVEMNAAAFKTNPDATAEDLVAKMPGIQVANGEVKAQGETVQKVLVDGKEYFGEDAATVLKNMPADMVDKIQIFDQKSDQAIFSGVDDGNTKKAMNIVTKNQYSNATFGKMYAGGGTENHYQAGFVVNDFRRQQKITLLGNFNNINQVNFTQQDLSGISSGGGGHSHGGGYSRGGGNSFNIGTQNGITGVNSFGMNYNNKLGTKLQATGSYFFNTTDNSNSSFTDRKYYAPAIGKYYRSSTDVGTYSRAHRANLRLEYSPDSVNSFVFAPKFNYQYTEYANLFSSQNYDGDSVINSSSGENSSVNTSWSLSGSLNYRHRFHKPGRTLAVELNGSYTDRTGTGKLNSVNAWYDGNDSTETLNQNSLQTGLSWLFAPSFSWSEKLGKQGIISFSYSPSKSYNISDKKTFNYDSLASDYVRIDSTVTSKYDNYVTSHRAGVNYRFRKNGVSWSFGVDGSRTVIDGQNYFPDSLGTDATFLNVLPTATMMWKKKKPVSIRVTYRTSTAVPTITQLQNVVDNTNPLSLTSGNPYLKQSYSHNLFARYVFTNAETSSSLFLFVAGAMTTNYIGQSLLVAENDTVIGNGVELGRGGVYTKPVNLNGYYNIMTFGAYSWPWTKMKSNTSVNWSYGLSSSPGVINGVKNIAFSNTFGLGASLTSNISEKVDFTLSWNGSYVKTNNTNSVETSNDYYYHTPGAKLNLLFGNGFVFNTDINYTSYRGLSGGFNQDYILWNAALGYKFAKKQQCEVRISAFDILKQNNSLARNITETYYEDVRTQVLSQYFMITFTWNIKKFRVAPSADGSGQSTGDHHQQGQGGGNGSGGGNGGGRQH